MGEWGKYGYIIRAIRTRLPGGNGKNFGKTSDANMVGSECIPVSKESRKRHPRLETLPFDKQCQNSKHKSIHTCEETPLPHASSSQTSPPNSPSEITVGCTTSGSFPFVFAPMFSSGATVTHRYPAEPCVFITYCRHVQYSETSCPASSAIRSLKALVWEWDGHVQTS